VTFNEALGKNDGSVKGIRYFDCQENCGLFVRASQVSRVVSSGISLPKCSCHMTWLVSDIAQVRAAMSGLAKRAEELEAQLARVIQASATLVSDAQIHGDVAPPATHRDAVDRSDAVDAFRSDAADAFVAQLVSKLERTALRDLEARVTAAVQGALMQATQELVEAMLDLQEVQTLGQQINADAPSKQSPHGGGLKTNTDLCATLDRQPGPAIQESTAGSVEPSGVKMKARRELLMAVDGGQLVPVIQEAIKNRNVRLDSGPKAKAKRLILAAHNSGLLNIAVDNAIENELAPQGGARIKARNQLLAALHNDQLCSTIMETLTAGPDLNACNAIRCKSRSWKASW